VCHAATQSKLWVSTIIDGQPVYDLKVMKISAIPDLCLYYSPAILNMRAFVVKSTQPTYGEELLEIGFPLNGPQTPTVGLYLYGNPDSQIAMKLSDADGCIGGEVVMSVFCVVTEDLQVTTVTTYPGNSGSPVFNEAGQMIGIMNSADNKTNYGQYVAGKYIQEFIRGL
jgi:S1-C subfamily serine protease